MTECAPTVNAAAGMSGNNKPFILVGVLNFQGSKGNNVFRSDETCFSINAMHGHDIHAVVQCRAMNGAETKEAR